MTHLSVVVPTLNEADNIVRALSALAPMRARAAEVIVVDAGSSDNTVALATPLADKVVITPRGRARQMNAGAAQAAGDVLLFVHADTELPRNADRTIIERLASSGKAWGRFDVSITGTHWMLPLIAHMINARSRFSGIATGDQAIFVRRAVFEEVGGFPEIPLMEDVALARRLKRDSRPLALPARVTTSGRRWEKHGVVQTIWLMWRLRFAFWRGADPDDLARHYAPHEQ